MFPNFYHISVFQNREEIKLYSGIDKIFFKNDYRYDKIHLASMDDIRILLHTMDHFLNAFDVLYNGESCIVKETDEYRAAILKGKPKYGWKKSISWLRYTSCMLNLMEEIYKGISEECLMLAVSGTRTLLDLKDEYHQNILSEHLKKGNKATNLKILSKSICNKNALSNIFYFPLIFSEFERTNDKIKIKVKYHGADKEIFIIRGDANIDLIKDFLSQIIHSRIPYILQSNSIYSNRQNSSKHIKIIVGFIMIEVLLFAIAKIHYFFSDCIHDFICSPESEYFNEGLLVSSTTFKYMVGLSECIGETYTQNMKIYSNLLKEPFSPASDF